MIHGSPPLFCISNGQLLYKLCHCRSSGLPPPRVPLKCHSGGWKSISSINLDHFRYQSLNQLSESNKGFHWSWKLLLIDVSFRITFNHYTSRPTSRPFHTPASRRLSYLFAYVFHYHRSVVVVSSHNPYRSSCLFWPFRKPKSFVGYRTKETWNCVYRKADGCCSTVCWDFSLSTLNFPCVCWRTFYATQRRMLIFAITRVWSESMLVPQSVLTSRRLRHICRWNITTLPTRLSQAR